MPEKESWRFVGQRIRQLRKSNQLTIRQLATGTGLSANAISLVERGEVAPTVATLCKIAHALGASVSTFFDEACPGENGALGNDPSSNDRCALNDPNRGLQRNQADLTQTPFPPAGGQALPSLLCLSGQLIYTLDGQRYLLGTGQVLKFDQTRPPTLRNEGKETGIALLVIPASSQ